MSNKVEAPARERRHQGPDGPTGNTADLARQISGSATSGRPFAAQDFSPLAWWRTLPSYLLRDAEHLLLIDTLDTIYVMDRHDDFAAALRGDAAAAVGVGVLAAAHPRGDTDGRHRHDGAAALRPRWRRDSHHGRCEPPSLQRTGPSIRNQVVDLVVHARRQPFLRRHRPRPPELRSRQDHRGGLSQLPRGGRGMSATSDNGDDHDLPAAEDAALIGAAADSADWDERLKGLPRLLRYAMLVVDGAEHIEERLIAEIEELCPHLSHNAAWATGRSLEAALALAAELDKCAAAQNEPALRSLADSVRLVSLPTPRDDEHFQQHRRVAKALVKAFQVNSLRVEQKVCCDLERFTYGWAALPACTQFLPKKFSAAMNASVLGHRMAEHRITAAKAALRLQLKEEEDRRKKREAEDRTGAVKQDAVPNPELIPDYHLVVARLSEAEMKNIKLKEILGPLKDVINTALPLVEAPPLHEARNVLQSEFPHAVDVIDFALADLVGRTTVRLRPLLIVGEPGGGKSRFARRLGEVLGVSVWRTDGGRSDGAVFGGTDRRWYSAEPCHAFLAIAQGRIANPLVLIDEIEKAATRSDYGRLWDTLLGFLEPETCARYPDPALQTNLDLSQVSYIATANRLDPLPSPIRDRFRIVTFPKPTANDLDALLPAVIADLAKERGLDQSWMTPLDGVEREAVAKHWPGGSVRRLRRIVEAVLRERDIRASRN
ncbi:ATP-dependent Lon protease [Bradyrhizobium japonicum]